MQVVGKRHRKAKERILHEQGLFSCPAGLFVMGKGLFFLFYCMPASSGTSAGWAGVPLLRVGSQCTSWLVGWMGVKWGRFKRRMKHGGT